ncbi:MAG: ABC transporter permease [Elusimicrobia bacterium]|nr:ABC transporter permease [Elusimicrobiota bacterium]
MNARRFLLASGTLVAREMTRFFRQRNRVIGAFATPLLFWFFLGTGLGRNFHAPPGAAGEGLNYLQYFLPGTMALVCLFTAIFSTISVIEDRQAGFLQAVLVSPAPRGSIVMGKLLGGMILAVIQAVVFVALMPVVGVPLTLFGVFWALVLLVLLSFGLTGLGLLIAWTTDSIQGFHAIMNLLLMPIWFLSGAVFPVSGAPGWLKVIMLANPVTYGVAGLQMAFFGSRGGQGPSMSLCVGVNLLFAGAMFLGPWLLVRRTRAT